VTVGGDLLAGKAVTTSQIASVGATSPQLASLLRAAQKVAPAQKAAPSEWRRWWLVCMTGQLFFLGIVFTIRGRWRPRSAQKDFEEHERLVTAELAKLRRQMAPAGAGDVWSGPVRVPAEVPAANGSPVGTTVPRATRREGLVSTTSASLTVRGIDAPLRATVEFRDVADQVVGPDTVPVWTEDSNGQVISLEVAPDGLSAMLTPLGVGESNLTVTTVDDDGSIVRVEEAVTVTSD
jgi:hypothetical protein